MKRPTPAPDWPETWRNSYHYDLLEVFGEETDRGYAYSYELRLAETLKMVQRVIKPPARILDVAAAQGNFSLKLAEMGYQVTWNDLRADLADYVRLKHTSGEIAYAPGNVFDLGFDEAFDLVLITEIIEHVAHPDQFLKKIRKIVKPGGYVVMTTPNGGYIRNHLPRFSACADPSVFEAMQFQPGAEGHIFLLHEDEIADLAVKAGLTMIECHFFTNPVTIGHMKTSVLLDKLPRSYIRALEDLTGLFPQPVKRRMLTSIGAIFRR